jgi:hypothetical protein
VNHGWVGQIWIDAFYLPGLESSSKCSEMLLAGNLHCSRSLSTVLQTQGSNIRLL